MGHLADLRCSTRLQESAEDINRSALSYIIPFRNPARADQQTADLRQFLVGLPPGETVILVTHYVNIRALTGRGVASGEVVLLKIGRDDRTISVVDEILIDPRR